MAEKIEAFTLVVEVNSRLVNTEDLSTPTDTLIYRKNFEWTNGTGADQANQHWKDQRTLAASATENLDLAGVLVSHLTGAVINFTSIRLIIVYAALGNANDVEVGGVGLNAFFTPFGANTDKLKVKPGGLLVLMARDAAGYAVTAGTGDLLKVANGGAGTSVTYDVILVGTV